MTQPDNSFPTSSANYGSLETWAGKTQQDWQAEQRAPVEAAYGKVFAGLFGGLQTGIAFVESILAYILNTFSQFVIRLAGLATTTFFTTLDEVFGTVISWVGRLFGLIGNANINQYPTVGTYVFGFERTVQFIDIIMIGGGGGGGSAAFFFTGQGGNCGTWVTKTLQRGVDFKADAETFSITVGAGGNGGVNGYGQPGQDTKVEYLNAAGNPRTLTAPGGAYGGPGLTHNPGNPNPHSTGNGAPNTSYRGYPYYGGPDVTYGTSGSAPGGGGGGGLGGPGGSGAHGRVWTVVRSTADEN